MSYIGEFVLVIVLMQLLRFGTICKAAHQDYCQCMSTSRYVKLPGCGHPSQWSRYDRRERTWIDVPNGDSCDKFCNEQDDLTINGVFRVVDDTSYRCEHLNITTSVNLTLYHECYCRPVILDPPEKLRIRQNLPGNHRTLSCSAYVGPCSVNHKCSLPNASVKWIFRRNHGNSVDPATTGNDDSPGAGGGIVETEMRYTEQGDIKIISTYTISSVTWNDYGKYTCNITNQGGSLLRTIQLKHGVRENVAVLPPPVFWVFLTICVLVLCALVLVIIALGYYYLLKIRVFYHLYFSKPEDGEYEYDGIVISTDSENDVNFVKENLLNTAVAHRMSLKLAYGPRDFDVGSDDASYLEFMRLSRRLIFVISPDFLSPDYAVCARAFRDASGLQRWTDMMFILLPTDQNLWTQDHKVLRETMDQCKFRFHWGVKRRFCCFDLSTWEEHSFWDKFLLAMPKTKRDRGLVLEVNDDSSDSNLVV